MVWGRCITCFTRVSLWLSLLALVFPTPVFAAAINPAPSGVAPNGAITLQFDILEVRKDQTVAIRTVDFPIRTHFTVSMEVVAPQTGTPVTVAVLDTGQGGALEAAYAIPEALRGQLILGLRIQSPDGYQAYRWFINENTTPKPSDEKGSKPELAFTQVKRGASVAVEGKNLPANATFWVRMGPFDTFFKNYSVGDMVTSGADGSAKFNLALPKSLQAAPYITVRLDYGATSVTGTYQNNDGGLAQDPQKLVKFEWCRVVSTASVPALAPGEAFDAVWKVQNISAQAWKGGSFGFKFKSGEKLFKYQDSYTINWTIRDGWSFDVPVDMIAPKEPGWHTTTWVMFRDNPNSEVDSDMCVMRLNLFVKGQ